jgi:peptidoglycan/xylan/chitin deacetylase (PgdA/CDA1 family)
MNMKCLRRLIFVAGLMLASLQPVCAEDVPQRIPILLYHRIGSTIMDQMTITRDALAEQLQMLHDGGYNVIPLRQLVEFLQGNRASLPPKPVVITADDGHISIFTDFFPLIRQYKIPVTLFIYPSAISNASYAMTWDQLREMQASQLVDVQSHSLWHPNFMTEKQRLSPGDYQAFVTHQLVVSRQVLEQHLGGKVDELAWPFGLYDSELMTAAQQAGYVAAFSIFRWPASRSEALLALPRYIVTQQNRGRSFLRLLEGAETNAAHDHE